MVKFKTFEYNGMRVLVVPTYDIKPKFLRIRKKS